jgi:hypothetical protein
MRLIRKRHINVDRNAKVVFVPLDYPRADDAASLSLGASHGRLLLHGSICFRPESSQHPEFG